MTDPVNEQLSACLDGELSAAEMELLLKRMARDEALGRTASRYSLIGAAARDEKGPLAGVDFASKVARAVAEEKLPASQTMAPAARGEPRRWLRPALTGTMAAGIAVFAVLIANRPDEGVPVPVPVPVAGKFERTDRLQRTADGGDARGLAGSERLANYVVTHSEYSSPLGRPMVLNGLLTEQSPEEERTPPPAAPSSEPSAPQP